MIKRLIDLANFLDGEGFVREANHLDGLIKKLSDSDDLGHDSLDSYASIISSYVENHPNKYEFDIKNAGIPRKDERPEEPSE